MSLITGTSPGFPRTGLVAGGAGASGSGFSPHLRYAAAPATASWAPWAGAEGGAEGFAAVPLLLAAPPEPPSDDEQPVASSTPVRTSPAAAALFLPTVNQPSELPTDTPSAYRSMQNSGRRFHSA
ncbi:hypothetical protein GCM10010394_39130 [Streptomyces crystallinus]|uniref:Uncharacterized protein n=1 Tax=Streptomyces crystallinus TaxID=68191 RepID=A0ABN1G785_9ACTN